MIWAAAKAALLACWALVLSYFTVSAVEQLCVGAPVAFADFGLIVLALAAVYFPGLWIAFAKVAQAEEGHDAR